MKVLKTDMHLKLFMNGSDAALERRDFTP